MAVDAERGTTPSEDVEALLAGALDAPARRPADPGLGAGIEAVAYWSFEPALEIVIARAQRPSDAQAVVAWRRRFGRRPVPLVLLIVRPHGRALVVGRGGDPPPVAELDLRAVADELAGAVELDPLQVRERLAGVWERARGAGGLAGVRNVGLCSTHYLAARAPRLAEWAELEATGRETTRRRSLQEATPAGVRLEPRPQRHRARGEADRQVRDHREGAGVRGPGAIGVELSRSMSGPGVADAAGYGDGISPGGTERLDAVTPEDHDVSVRSPS